jgi:hypothetical protein
METCWISHADCSTTALPDNPVNLPSEHGVQIELPPGLRGIGDFGEHLKPNEDGVVTDTIAALVELSDRASELIRPSLDF